jgi:hypothetical protein
MERKLRKYISFYRAIACICFGVLLAAMLSACAKTGGENKSPTVTPDKEQEEKLAELSKRRKAAMDRAEALALRYFYDEALEALSDPEITDSVVLAKRAEIEAEKGALVNYEGDIKHIFFHSLIVYPEMIFKDLTTPMGGYNSGFSEKAELERMLPQLYERGYVLYSLNECYEKVDGKMQRKEILLPPGKQPLILSIDDVAYAYGDGYASQLIVDEDGSLTYLVKNPQGEIEKMPDGDVMGVVDAFVDEHPDFSYHGHKGTLALTGFQGAFGHSYKTEEGQVEIKKVAEALKAEGWSFASHSYTHNRTNFYGKGSDPANIQYDINKWINVVTPCLGQTRLFIAPFGYLVKQPGLQYILDAGFDIYCIVSSKVENIIYDDYVLMSRIEIGGYSMTYYKKILDENYFNVDEVFDHEGRPPVR